MRERFFAHSLIIALIACSLLKPDARTKVSHPQEPATVAEPFVQVTSVTIEPSAIHKGQEPNTLMVTAQILLRGSAASNPKAVVEVGTSSSDPPNNSLRYDEPTRTVSLRKGVTVVKFKAESTPKTFAGKLKVAVTLGGATKGINIKDSEPENYITEVKILEP